MAHQGPLVFKSRERSGRGGDCLSPTRAEWQTRRDARAPAALVDDPARQARRRIALMTRLSESVSLSPRVVCAHRVASCSDWT